MTLELPTTTSDWLAHLEEETALLRALAQHTISARGVSLRDAEPEFRRQLAAQEETCRQLEQCRRRRRDALRRAGRDPSELVAVVTAGASAEALERAQDALNRWFEAAEATRRENDINRDFYGVALAAVEEAVGILTGSETRAYDLRGRSVPGQGRATVVTSI